MRLIFIIIIITCITKCTAQEHSKIADFILKIYTLGDLNKEYFQNHRHPVNSIFVIKNRIVEPDSIERIESSISELDNFTILFYPRKYLIGYEINYWIQIDSVQIKSRKAFVKFRTVYSNDNWFEENDKTHYCGRAYFIQLEDSTWHLKRHEIQDLGMN